MRGLVDPVALVYTLLHIGSETGDGLTSRHYSRLKICLTRGPNAHFQDVNNDMTPYNGPAKTDVF